MDNFKKEIIENFARNLDNLDLTLDNHSLELKFNNITEKIFDFIKLKKDKFYKNTKENNNISYSDDFDNPEISSGKSSETLISSSDKNNFSYVPNNGLDVAKSIPENFSLTYEMEKYAKFKFIEDVQTVFEHFKLHYQSNMSLRNDWVATWKIWVINQNKYKTTHLVKTTIDENIKLENNYLSIAKKYINKSDMQEQFKKYKNYYISNGDIKVHSQWEKVWENWCINHKKFKPKEQSIKQKEKADYRWDFKKAKNSSDKIKNWLEFEKKINWLDDFYLKDIPLPGIGWSDVIHPDYNKQEILLFKIDSPNGQYMLKNKNDDIEDVEIVE